MTGPRSAPPAAPDSSVDMNMTPMIDIVFQLIVFLMIANDMSRREIEDLHLPAAPNASRDDGPEKDRRLIVNLLKGPRDGVPALKVRGRDMDLADFRRLLEVEADACPGSGADSSSTLQVLVRADRGARWQDVQCLMQVCADPEIRVSRLQFATEDPREERE